MVAPSGRVRSRSTLTLSVAASLALAACAPRAPLPVSDSAARAAVPAAAADSLQWKTLEFAILEDYDKGDSLADIARDFALFRELGVTTWRGSFGWDDYEPAPGEMDLEWLHRFARLAAEHGIALRPYLAYTPEWAAAGRTADGFTWNDPPRRLEEWARFAGAIASAMRRHPNVVSFEIYNEENVPLWWDGTVAEYAAVVARGAAAIDTALPNAALLMGGMVWPDAEWVERVCVTADNAARIDVIPFHAYPETWTPDSVTVENYLGEHYASDFLPAIDAACGEKPVWINEMGFATVGGRTERDQARWWARAIATFAAAPRVAHLGIYEIKDLPQDEQVIGDPENYNLGLTRTDRTKKEAFATVRLLVRFLGGRIAVRDAALAVSFTGPTPPHAHLFERPDGTLVLVTWVATAAQGTFAEFTLPREAGAVTQYALDGRAMPFSGVRGRTLSGVELRAGDVRILEIAPPPR